MNRRPTCLVLSICCLVLLAPMSAGQQSSRGLLLEINIIDTTGLRADEVEKIQNSKTQIERLSEDKSRSLASVQVRTRIGESFSVRAGQRDLIRSSLFVEGLSALAGDGLLDIRLKLEMSGLDRNGDRLTSPFSLESFTDVVRMKESETVVLMGLSHRDRNSPTLEQIASGGSTPVHRSSLIILLTTKPAP